MIEKGHYDINAIALLLLWTELRIQVSSSRYLSLVSTARVRTARSIEHILVSVNIVISTCSFYALEFRKFYILPTGCGLSHISILGFTALHKELMLADTKHDASCPIKS